MPLFDRKIGEIFMTGNVSPKACGWRVRLAREMIGGTREEFAPRIDMGAKNLQSVEVGKSYLRPAYAGKLYEEFKIDQNFIFYGEFSTLSVGTAQRLLEAAERIEAQRPTSDDAGDRRRGSG